jgi:peptidoglycan/xylan/chitin deacetylase (PgdA/CDA1 family)
MRRARRLAVALLALVLVGAAFLPGLGSARNARHVVRSHSGRVTVLGYHAIADLGEDPLLADFSVPPARFASQLDTLLRRGWSFVDLDAVLAALRGERSLPDRALLLTFDDAYADLLEAACPILEERRIPAVVFAVSDEVGGTNSWDVRKGGTSLPLLSAEGLAEVASRGIEVGSHTASHPALTEVPAGQLGAELEGSADRLAALGLPRPRAFSYPFGLWDERVTKAVEEAGYEVAFAVDRGMADGKCNRFAVPRLAVHADDSGLKLHLKLVSLRWPNWVREPLRWVVGKRPRLRSAKPEAPPSGESAPGAQQRTPSGYSS